MQLSFDPGSGTTISEVALTDTQALALMRSNAARLLDAGVTTTRDLGAPGTLAAQIKTEVAAGTTPGPNLQVANAPITVRKGHAFRLGGEAEGVESVRAAVRERKPAVRTWSKL